MRLLFLRNLVNKPMQVITSIKSMDRNVLLSRILYTWFYISLCSFLLYAVFGVRLWVEMTDSFKDMPREMSMALLHIMGLFAGPIQYFHRKY